MNRDEITLEIEQMTHAAAESEFAKLLQFFGQVLKEDPEHLDALYGYGVICFRMNNLKDAKNYFQRAYKRASLHTGLAWNYINLCTLDNDFEKIYEVGVALLPRLLDDPILYRNLHTACQQTGRVEEFRSIRAMMAAHCAKGYHYQLRFLTAFKDLYPDQFATLAARPPPKPIAPKKKKTPKPVNTPPEPISGDATPVGMEGLSLNGSIGGTNLPTRYFFRYGTSPANLDGMTAKQEVPPGRHGRTIDTGTNTFSRISSFGYTIDFEELGGGKAATIPGPATQAVMQLEDPFGKDRNHINGIGIIDLVFSWSHILQVRDRVGDEYAGDSYPQKIYPGESLDLRDAEISAVLRSNDFDVRDFRFVAWFHANAGTALVPDQMEDMAPWALTADMKNNQIIADGKWREHTFTFRSDSNDWSFSGNNIEEKGSEIGRYLYHPIGESLRQNRGGNICLAFVCGNDVDTPVGKIELASLSLRYRSQSLLGPGFGGEWIDAPDKGSDASALTQGWIGNEEYYWQSAAKPKAPQEFTWKFADKATVESVRLHQNHHWPAKEVEVLISTNGKKFTPLWKAELRKDAAGFVVGPEDAQGADPKNLASIHIPAKPVKASYLKLRILSGYKSKHWGLDAIEVFGKGPRPIPEIEPCSVSEDIAGFKPGTEVFYQLVAENEKGVSEGEIKSLVLPADNKPIIHWAKVLERTKDKATIVARVTAMGSFTELTGVLGNSKEKTVSEASATAGKWPTPRHVTLSMGGLTARRKFKATIKAVNEAGESTPMALEIGPLGESKVKSKK